MACSHATTCPLFPLLNESVDGWRRCYCDSPAGWRDCARYQQSVRGQYVPLSLLPNGRDARHLQNAGTGHGPNGQDVGTNLVDLLFEQAPAPPPALIVPEPRRPDPHPPTSPPAPRRTWWTRLTEWMRTPA